MHVHDATALAPQDNYYPPNRQQMVDTAEPVAPHQVFGPIKYAPALGLYAIGGTFLLYLDAANATTALHQSGSYLAALAAIGVDAARVALPIAGRLLPSWRVAALATGLLCLAYSSVSSFETANASRADTASARSAGNADRVRVQAEYDTARTALGLLTPSRSELEVNSALIGGAGVPLLVWSKTAGCQDVTLPASQLACAPASRLFAERGIAQRRSQLEGQIKDAGARLALLPAETVTDAGAVLMTAFVPGMTADQARLAGSAVQIATFEVLASVLLSIAAAAWAASTSQTGAQPRWRAEGQQGHKARLQGQTPASGAGNVLRASGGPLAVHGQGDPPVTRQRPAADPQHGLAALIRVLETMGGTFTGSQIELAELVGVNRSAARRLVNAAAVQKLVALATVPGHRTTVRLLRPRLAVTG